MKVSYQWLKELAGVDWPVEEVAERLTLCGTACEDIVATDRYLDKVVVGHVTAIGPVKGADKIKLVTVNLGEETLDLICGAPNVEVDQKVAVALVGARLAGDIIIKKAKIRGVVSCGMICSERELGFSEDHSGIIVLDPAAVPGEPLADHLDYHDYILGFELTPNRADSMSALGIARDLAGLAGTSLKYPEYDLKTIDESIKGQFEVTSEDLVACPRFTARIIRNIKIGPSPWWMQKKLLTAGMRPISNAVDISNYVMLLTGNPIHAFDYDRFGSDKIVVRRAKQGERLTTLDGKDHELTPDVLLITDGKTARAAAGVMGGFDSEVTDDTKNILLEVAYFDPSAIRKSRKTLGMTSEASNRFEKGVDPNNVHFASALAAQLLHELCEGDVLDSLIDFYPESIEPVTVTLRPERCHKILGVDFGHDKIVSILRSLEFEVTEGEPIAATIPTFRPDITREIDLIEEVARMAGFDAIPDATENIGPLFAPANKTEQFEGEIRTVMTGAGFDEILGHGLADSKQANWLDPSQPQLKIINPVSEDLDIMRNDLVQTALTAIAHNVAHRNLDLRLFEIGRAYFPPDAAGEWVEDERLLLAVSGSLPGDWRNKPRLADFYDLRGGVDRLCLHFHWPEFSFQPVEHPYLEPDQAFEITLDGEPVGSIGKIKAKTARKFEIKQDVYVAQLRLDKLHEHSSELIQFKPLPVFPAATRDLAVVVATSVPAGELSACIREVAGKYAESIDIFDIYTGQQIGEGRKSVALAIKYRAEDRSMSSDEIDEIQERITKRLKKDFKAEIRDK